MPLAASSRTAAVGESWIQMQTKAIMYGAITVIVGTPDLSAFARAGKPQQRRRIARVEGRLAVGGVAVVPVGEPARRQAKGASAPGAGAAGTGGAAGAVLGGRCGQRVHCGATAAGSGCIAGQRVRAEGRVRLGGKQVDRLLGLRKCHLLQ